MAKDLFGNEIIEKQTINRFDLEKILFAKMSSITLEEFVRMITNEFNELIEYAKLLRGKKHAKKRVYYSIHTD